MSADAIVNDGDLRSHLAALRRRRRQFVVPTTVLALVAIAVAFSWPPVYRSAATILIEQQEIPQDLIPTTVTSYADQRLQVIGQRVMTSSNLLGLVQKFDLYPDDVDEPSEVLVEMMHDDIAVDVVSAEVVDPRNGRATLATIAFTVAYEHESPELAYRVSSELTSLYLDENLKSRSQTVEETTAFLTQEAARLAREVSEIEHALALFKEEHITRLPELTDLNMRFLDRVEHDRAALDEQIRTTAERRIYLETMLRGMETAAPAVMSAHQVLSPAERKRLLEASLVSMTAIYGADHPDVQRARRELAALDAQTGATGNAGLAAELAAREAELTDARLRYAPDHPDVLRLERAVAELRAVETQHPAAGIAPPARSDPTYLQLYGQLQAAIAQAQALAAKRQDLDTQYAELQARLVEAPKIESEYRALTRDYEATSAQYLEISGKLAEARLAESLEAGRKGERFTVIEPATRSEEPVRPNRLAILLLGWLLALAAGIGSVAVAEALDESVRGFAAATALAGQAPMALIPVIVTAAESAASGLRRWLVAGGATAAATLALVLVHLLVMPLGTLWLLALKRFGL